MPFNFTFGGELPQWTIEIYVGDAMVEQQTISAPWQSIAMNFAQIVNNLHNQPQPMKAICRGTQEVQVGFNEWKELPAYIEYRNLRWDGEI